MAASAMEVARDLVVAWVQNQGGARVTPEAVAEAYQTLYTAVVSATP